jgi:hypothetical protein
MLPKGPEWRWKRWTSPYPTKKKLDLFYRDPLACIQSILLNPLMKDHLQFSPLRIFDSAARAMRIYSEWLTGDVAWSMQVSPRLPFDHLQVWTKVQLQNRSYHTPHHILPPQTINALPRPRHGPLDAVTLFSSI